MNFCAVIPHYEHVAGIAGVIEAVRNAGLPALIVDDGSSAKTCCALDAQLQSLDGVHLRRRETNGGKGAAVRDGLRWAWTEGYTHAIQIDADGQHDLDNLSAMMECATCYPEKIICAMPVFDASAPKSRLYGRKLTNFWVAIETLSMEVKEAMCGFRVYPLTRVIPVLGVSRMSDRMAFDIEVLVRCYWDNIDVHYIPTRVGYPPDGISHFRMIQDNVLITATHVRLVLGMLCRLPGRAIRLVRGGGSRETGPSTP